MVFRHWRGVQSRCRRLGPQQPTAGTWPADLFGWGQHSRILQGRMGLLLGSAWPPYHRGQERVNQSLDTQWNNKQTTNHQEEALPTQAKGEWVWTDPHPSHREQAMSFAAPHWPPASAPHQGVTRTAHSTSSPPPAALHWAALPKRNPRTFYPCTNRKKDDNLPQRTNQNEGGR